MQSMDSTTLGCIRYRYSACQLLVEWRSPLPSFYADLGSREIMLVEILQ